MLGRFWWSERAKSIRHSLIRPFLQFFGAIPGGRRWRLDGLAGLREVIQGVRFTDGIEVVKPKAQAA